MFRGAAGEGPPATQANSQNSRIVQNRDPGPTTQYQAHMTDRVLYAMCNRIPFVSWPHGTFRQPMQSWDGFLVRPRLVLITLDGAYLLPDLGASSKLDINDGCVSNAR